MSGNSNAHEKVEKNIGLMAVLIAVVVSFGGLAEIVPLMYQAEAIEPLPGVEPYPPLELAGRDVYVREGCYNCHSQMVRTLRFETERYGHYSLAGESVYDRPFQWGSKRTGPDLARVGGKYSDAWHTAHLKNPRDVVPESVMPRYGWLQENNLRTNDLSRRLAAQRAVGVPYDEAMIANAASDAYGQANPDSAASNDVRDRYGAATNIRAFDGDAERLTEMDAIIAYLQVLGRLTDAAHAPVKTAGASTAAGG
jgi:cytochrome c oxidase cbb3-type subunit 2